MRVIKNEQVSMFDVDETLVISDPLILRANPHKIIKIWNPYLNTIVERIAHREHVDLLQHMKGRGRFIGVWSGNGAKWAEEVVRALDLENFVSIVMTKPIVYVDDMPAESWLNNRVYLKSEGK